ncbi:hypothetical protein F751_4360 [Auxenochlorella protothecoides]|uniref:Uncharacterized protein n=1 Tax=Auxenochlorella protothecoides TaxID=3075 RepID=A0A087SCM4_AUXPR|nr:hypothetical protein F751_4360 [Auxenochlorella protothecoides]KFM23478.1 hypothetical protein F751_4360 [Auxenochlorella protothecoides]
MEGTLRHFPRQRFPMRWQTSVRWPRPSSTPPWWMGLSQAWSTACQTGCMAWWALQACHTRHTVTQSLMGSWRR